MCQKRDNNLNEDYKRHILSMELQILKGINWRLRAVTAMYFKEFFVGKIPAGKGIMRRTLNEIIIQAQGGKLAYRRENNLKFCRFCCSNHISDTLNGPSFKLHEIDQCLRCFDDRHQFYTI